MSDELNNFDFQDDGQGGGRQLNKNQKIALGIFGFLGILVVFFWAAQLKNSISGPFNYEKLNSTEENPTEETCTGPDCEQSEDELKNKDTDKDGLSDWNELNVYKTSPYLEDSDSDGFSDKEEVDNNKDPNCPTGKDCSDFSEDQFENATSTSQNLMQDLGITEESGNNEDLQNILTGQASANNLRQILLQSGISQEELDQVSDEELMSSYNDTLQNSLDSGTSE